ncbi:hypothetical protein KBD08_04035 [Candidatus Babeliales bacterium]|nr:hypothetical protein [Candidatus Babeliales bacterium]
MIYFIVTIWAIITGFGQIMYPRDPRRPSNPTIPLIKVSSSNLAAEKTWASTHSNYNPDSTHYEFCNSFLRLKPIKEGFNQTFFQENYLPSGVITFRNQQGIVSSNILSDLANEVIEEIKVGQRHFTHFKKLKDKDFNYKTLSGLIILKYKNYPFVIKISIEHPYTLTQPFSRSYEATGIFVIGGNLRHLSNFTRITNLNKIRKILSYHPFYRQNLDFPRKWYWKPDKCYDLRIDWCCNGICDTISIPSIYATISDFIETEAQQPQNELNKLSMKVAIDVGFLIDPHAGNIVIEKNTRKYILLDTEDFRLMTGLNKSMKARKYIGWYIELISNALKTSLLRTKQERIEQSMLV